MNKANNSFIQRTGSSLIAMTSRYYKFGEGDSVPINQDPSRDFNINPDTGRPMSVITALLRSQNAAEQMAIFSGLEEFKSNYLPEGTKDEDAIKFMMPRYCQLPSQVAQFAAELRAEKDIEEFNKVKADEESKKLEEAAKAAKAVSPVGDGDGSASSASTGE